MNLLILSKYLQLLRKEHGYTQEDLAQKLTISRQAVSKWETGNTAPDLDTLLKLSKLYDKTINELLEPKIESANLRTFEDITKIPESSLIKLLSGFNIRDLVKAAMGASPAVNDFLQNIYTDIDFRNEQQKIGRVRIDEIEDLQNQIVAWINLAADNE